MDDDDLLEKIVDLARQLERKDQERETYMTDLRDLRDQLGKAKTEIAKLTKALEAQRNPT